MNRRQLLGAGALLAAVAASGPVLAAGDIDRFSVVVRGKGPDVILIPGLSSSRAVWEPTAKALEGRYRVHLVQVAGFAGDPAGANAEGKVAARVAEGLAAYIQAKGLKAPAVIGHSMGGTIGLMLAARHPGLVGKLMVVDMFPNLAVAYFGPAATPEAVAKSAAEFRQQIETAPQEQFVARQNQTAAMMVLTESARKAVVDDSLASDRKVSGRAMEELLTTNLTPELPKITAPTTVVWAWNKASFAPAEAFGGWYKAAYAPLAGAKIVRIDESAHFVMIDQPAAFQAEVENFLKG
ncbi:alpha/beta fold hydrolase [Caulobacter hibisci]|uniref:Alpha/beta hydrolase n=1 Tax=Caulobacter hibisci TaxID=2035993 RepID=A0ABS0T374_9CAUL|nr:alpha/beta hydrolase [Caulobacter hibisci]MBI1686196.1 alpha/beta hydrolase [Caulobacter hibisci]